MFPYPSGKGLHIGHLRGYTASDILARMYRMQGFAVLHPINRFRQQLQRLGFSYDYSKEISTADPDYFKTTQLIFI